MKVDSRMPLIVQKLAEAGISFDDFKNGMRQKEIDAVANDWSLWGLPYQQIPPGDWEKWIFRAGRGSGKTHTGARVTSEIARDRKKIRRGEIAVIGRTIRDARKVMIEGPSGILACCPSDFRPHWSPGKGKLTWPNGVVGYAYSSEEPEQVRGGNFAWAWLDEPGRYRNLYEFWDEAVYPALRVGWARCMFTTTPKRTPDLRKIEEEPGSFVTNASTYDNPYLSQSKLQKYRDRYEGTRSGRLEMLGQYIDENDNALWRLSDIESYRVSEAPDLVRIVVAIDPAVTSDEKSDETGIIIAGRGADDRGYILHDATMKGRPAEWARRAVAQYHRWQASRIVAEVNNGGDMVEETLRTVDKNVPYKAVRASRGKFARAEPISGLYERGRISHVGVFPELEDQMVNWDPTMSKSPDRLDALVWALHELFFDRSHVGPLEAYLKMGAP